MTGRALPWLRRPGLAGGIDKDGGRGAELLALGFGSVEFGTVAADGSAAALAARLAALPGRAPGSAAIGVGIGLPAGTADAGLPAAWLAGLGQTWQVADYLSFNLSARACRPLLAPGHLPLLGRALAAVAAARRRLPAPLPLALKLPLGTGEEPLPVVAEMAAGAGFDLITLVLPEAGDGLGRLAALARRLAGGPALVAVGGIRNAADVAAARRAGARGVQVHRLFAERGEACLPDLLGTAGAAVGNR